MSSELDIVSARVLDLEAEVRKLQALVKKNLEPPRRKRRQHRRAGVAKKCELLFERKCGSEQRGRAGNNSATPAGKWKSPGNRKPGSAFGLTPSHVFEMTETSSSSSPGGYDTEVLSEGETEKFAAKFRQLNSAEKKATWSRGIPRSAKKIGQVGEYNLDQNWNSSSSSSSSMKVKSLTSMKSRPKNCHRQLKFPETGKVDEWRKRNLRNHKFTQYGAALSTGRKKSFTGEFTNAAYLSPMYRYRTFVRPNKINAQWKARFSNTGKFSCKFCMESFDDLARMFAHLIIHTGRKPFPCLACRREFSTSKNLKKHTEKYHTTKQGFEFFAAS